MYSFNWCLKTVNSLISCRHREAQCVLKLLRKTIMDATYLLQRSNFGWNLFKKLIKSKEVREIAEIEERFWNKDAFYDYIKDQMGDLYVKMSSAIVPNWSEIEYLTRFFGNVTISESDEVNSVNK